MFVRLFIVCLCVLSAPSVLCAEPGDHQDLSYWVSADGERLPIKSVADWEHRRQAIVANVELVMGALPQPATPVDLAPQILEEHDEDGIIRRKVAYHTDSATATVKAWLLLPKSASAAKRPAVLCLHQTVREGKDEPAGLVGNPNLHYARHLAERGFVTLAPDYPSLGEYEYDFDADAYESGSMKAIYDNVRAIDFLQSLPEVDGERIGAIGHSLGGHNGIFTAVFEPRIKAIVSCCGFTRVHKYYGGNLRGWDGERYMPRIASDYHNDPDLVPFDYPELIAALAPRPFLAVAPLHDHNFEVSGVRDTMEMAAPVYRLLNAADDLQAVYPDAAHDFPPESRRQAYEFLEKALAAPVEPQP